MKKLSLIIPLLIILSSAAFCTGVLKLVMPTDQYQVIIDGGQVQATGEVVSFPLADGFHDVTVNLLDEETSVIIENVSVGSKEAALIKVPLKQNGVGAGFAIGMDASNVRLGKDDSIYQAGPIYNLCFFYSAPIKKNLFIDFELTLLQNFSFVQTGERERKLFALSPVGRLGLKAKANKWLMVGSAFNYSVVGFKDEYLAANAVGGLGFNAYFEIIPLALEIGYISKNQALPSIGNVTHYSGGGLYFQYKFYL